MLRSCSSVAFPGSSAFATTLNRSSPRAIQSEPLLSKDIERRSHAMLIRWLRRAFVIWHRPGDGAPVFSLGAYMESTPWQLPLTPLIPSVAGLTDATSNASRVLAGSD